MRILNALGFPHTVKNPKTIYIGLMGGVGDLVVAAPTIAALKKKFPKAHLTLGVQPGVYCDIVANDPHIDQFDTLFFKWPPTKSFRKLFANRKNLFIKNMQYDMVRFLDGIIFKKTKWRNGEHTIDHFAEFCGVTLSKRRAIVYLNNQDIFQAEEILKIAGIEEKEPFVVIAPETGSQRTKKEWPYENFVQLIKRIKNKFNLKILISVPPSSLQTYPGATLIRGEKTIRDSAAIIAKARLYIGCDNGLTHIASAFNTPTLSIHIGYPIELYGALSPHVTFISNAAFVFPNSKKGNEVKGGPKPITVDRVFEQVEKALATRFWIFFFNLLLKNYD